MLVLFGTPLAALANCSSRFAMTGHCGGEHCPMMHAKQQAATQTSDASSSAGSCCKVSSLPPGVTRAAVSPEGRVIAQPVGGQIAGVVPLATAPDAAPRLAGSPFPVSPPPQALLCTFLV